jgi:hypothetical protein
MQMVAENLHSKSREEELRYTLKAKLRSEGHSAKISLLRVLMLLHVELLLKLFQDVFS